MTRMMSRTHSLAIAILAVVMAGAVGGGMSVSAKPAERAGGLALGSPAPDFHLKDVVSGKLVSKDDAAKQPALLVMFICRHCPYVQHVKPGLAKLGRDYQGRPLAIVAISSNDAEKVPMDAPESLKEMAQEAGFTFPVLFDKTQEVAKAYDARHTPEYYLFDAKRRLVYHGQFDDSRPGNAKPLTGADLRAAIDAVLAGQPVSAKQKSSFGCSIKWK